MDNIQMVAQHKRKVIQHGPYSLYPVSQGIVDIFQGSGWGQHSRYRNHKGKWFWLSGTRLDPQGLPNA